jgi:hypothetical protein
MGMRHKMREAAGRGLEWAQWWHRQYQWPGKISWGSLAQYFETVDAEEAEAKIEVSGLGGCRLMVVVEEDIVLVELGRDAVAAGWGLKDWRRIGTFMLWISDHGN